VAERGEFTRKFDRDILGDESAEAEERQYRQRLADAEERALEAEFSKILNVLEYRAGWLKQRFPSMREPAGVDFRGRRFEFRTDDNKLQAWIEFRCRLTDSQQGIMIESFMEHDGVFPKRYDYVSFPKEQVKIDKAKRFIESKILEFAGSMQAAQAD
jgi:hypothetical protein